MKEMTNTPQISIVMPVYNSAKYLNRSIESLLGQTYSNLEIIILDDASTDNSWEIIQKFAQKDSRIKAYSIPFVDGPKVARDCAIRRATSDWIVPIDSDDTVERDFVDKLWERHLETNADFVGALMIMVDEDGNSIGETIPRKGFDFSAIFSGTEAMLRILSYWQFSAAGGLWNRQVMTNISPEGTYYDYADEYDTRVYINNCEKVAFEKAEYYYTQHLSSCTHSNSIHSLTYLLFNKIKLKKYFDAKYGSRCALSEYYLNSIVQEYKRNFPKLARACIKVKPKLGQEYIDNLTNAYGFFRDEYIGSHYFLVQYYRLLWAIVRRVSIHNVG